MQTGNAGFPVSVICLCLAISGALADAVDNMEGNATASEGPIRQSQSLGAGEQEYVFKRKQIILESLNSLGVNCTADSVPHIALLGSGGGQRAAVGLVGSLYQMKREGLLDTLLYLGGVSGSTWSMASLYNDSQWSTSMDSVASVLSGPEFSLQEIKAWVDEKAKDEDFSLTDVWGVLTSAGIMKQMDTRHLSDEASRNATNPYPIYSAIEKECFTDGPVEGQWFELSPHEAGFTEVGLFLETSLLGSKFQNGELLEKKPEMDMVQLQGILTCALADEDVIKEYIPAWLSALRSADSTVEEYLRAYNALNKLVALTRSTIQDPDALSDLDKLQEILKDMVNHNESALQGVTRESLFQQWSRDLQEAVTTWSQSLGATPAHVSLITTIAPLIIKWEWGTTSNFLYQYPESSIPPCLHSKENFHLMDAGLLINVAYPSFLGDKRDIDLIIAPEYSAGDMFETLTLARDYAAEVKKPFPAIDNETLADKDWPKDCYVFEGTGKEPSIVYMPLFNRRNCKDAEEFKAKMDEFATFQRPFSQESIEFLLETAKANVRNNKEILLREINKAALRRHGKEVGMGLSGRVGVGVEGEMQTDIRVIDELKAPTV